MKLPKKSDALVGQDKELNDSEEGFLNPEDLSIIDEKTWEPSDEEILSYALKLGYDIEKDPDELFEVAYYYMKYPLPEGWRRAIYKKTKELMYINMEDGEIEVVTEIEEMAHQMYLEKKEEMMGKKIGLSDKEDKKETKKNEKNKIPPLNPVKKSTSPPKSPTSLPSLKDKTNSKNNLLNEIENELLEKKILKNDMGIDTDLDFEKNKDIKKKNNDDIFDILDQDIKTKDKDNEKVEEKDKNEKKEDIYGMQAKESEEEEENEYGDEFDYDGIDDDSDLNKGEPLIKSMINKEKEKEKEEKELKYKEEKAKIEKEIKELKEKELKELKEKEEKEEKEKKEREEKEREEKEKKEKELKEKEEREKEEAERKEREEKEKREKELREQKLKEKEEREKLEKEKKEKEEKLKKELEKEKELNDKLIKEKKNYLNKKLKELQEYKEEKKRIYEKEKKGKEEKNKKLKEEYNSKLEKNINKNKTKLQSQYKEKIELYESQLINKKSKEEKAFTNDQKYKYEEKQKESKSKKEKEYEEKKNELKEKKSKLMKEIKEEKNEKEKNESSMKEKKMNLQKHIKLLDEKKKIDINNKNKKHDLLIKDYEIELENKLMKEKEQIKEYITNNILNYNTSISSLNFSMSGINKEDENNEFIKSKLLENIQKSLEDEYEINCKEIEQQLNNNKIKEIEKYKISMEQEIKDKIQFYKNENLSNEKEYYQILSNIRQNSQKKKLDSDKYLNDGFEQTMKEHEETKNKISIDNKKLMSLVVEGIQKLMLKNNSVEQTEIHIEEYLMELKDTYFIMFQKNKNVYEMEEYDFNHKKLFVKYLLEVINYLSKVFYSANNLYDIDKKNISESLLQFCKNKINDYKNKYQNKKKKRIYKFLNDNLLFKAQQFSTLSEFEKTRETNNIFVNSFKRRYDNEGQNMNKNMDNNKNENILNKINVDESINNITKNSFIFKKNNNLIESQNNNLANTMNNFNNFQNNNFNSSNGFNNMNFYSTFNRTKSLNDYNINEKFFKLLNKGKDNVNKLEFYTIDQNTNCKIPLIPENILQNIDEDILIAYSDIIIFLKNEYLKLIDINKGKNKIKKNTNLNKLILDKIQIYTEEAFNYIINNYENKEQYKNIQRKIKTVQNHIEDFKKNFNVDKYLENPNIYKTPSLADYIINNKMISNGQNYKAETNGINNLILNGNFNEFETK